MGIVIQLEAFRSENICLSLAVHRKHCDHTCNAACRQTDCYEIKRNTV